MTSTTNHKSLPKRWRVHHQIPDDVSNALHDFSPLLRQLLYNRGYQDPESAAAFLEGKTNFPTDPFLLSGMTKAVKRINHAVMAGEKIVVYGDYDADGITSTALLIGFFSSLGVKATPYIPDRYEEGYGLNNQAIRHIAEKETNLIITVDCGVRALKEVTLANELGMDVIVSDHHVPGDEMPPAMAIIDPKQPGDPYPEKELAGVGLAYKIAQAYLMEFPEEEISADDWLDLVAIGTVVDIAPLKGENRILVKAGLENIRHSPRQGIYALAQVARVNVAKCSAANLGFVLGPRLNAAGRLESALIAYDLLITDDPFQAGQLAQKLDNFNRQRQDITQKIREQASDLVLSDDPEAVLFFAAHPDFSEGVVGLAASRLVDSFYRPSIVGHQGEAFTKASCRSIPEFHITHALDDCAELLERHGGHAAAAGFTVRNENVDELVAKLRKIAAEKLEGVELMPELKIDRRIKLDKLTRKYIGGILNDLQKLEPTGRSNPEPVFASYDVEVRFARAVGREGSHLKLTLQAGGNTFDAIAFRQGYWKEDMPERINLAYRFEINEFNGRSSLQLNVKDIKAAE